MIMANKDYHRMDNFKILIVEDNIIVAEDIRIKLEQMGYPDAVIAANFEDALHIAQQRPPVDLALMDIQLNEDRDGIDTATALRKSFNVPVIYVTAFSDEATLDRARQTDPYGYLTKPFNDEDLKTTLKMALNRLKSDRQILESKQWLQTTLKSIGDGVIASNRKGAVKFMNPVAESMLGWREADALGLEMDSVVRLIDASTSIEIENPVPNQLLGEKSGEQISNALLVTRGGDTIPVACSTSPILGEKKEIIGVVMVLKDQTRERHAFQALKKSERRFRTVVDNIGIGVVLLNPEMEVIQLNRQMRKWFPEVDVKKQCICHKVFNTPPRDTVCEGCPSHESLRDGKIHEAVIPLEQSRRVRHMRIVSSAIRDDDGEIQVVIEIVDDITERLQAEELRQQSQKLEAIGNLAGGIAHDFNNILTSIIGFTELALEEAVKGSDIEGNLQEIYIAGKRARDLVKQILAFARQSEEEIKPIKISRILKEVLKFIRSSLPTTIDIQHEIESDALIMGSPIHVHQVMMNLCTNAAQAMEVSGGTLWISLKDVDLPEKERPGDGDVPPGKYIEMIVSDTGEGMASDILDSIFEPYFTTKEMGEGTGIGLAVVHGIVDSYNGRIAVESEVNKGSTFTIFLPVADEDQSFPPMEISSPASGNETILFVDDEPQITKLGGRTLENLGYTVKQFSSSVDALHAFKTNPRSFDLVITDMTMPQMTGEELAVEILQINPDIPILLCTGYNKRISDEKALEIGFKALIYKPFVIPEFAKTVRSVLDESKEKI